MIDTLYLEPFNEKALLGMQSDSEASFGLLSGGTQQITHVLVVNFQHAECDLQEMNSRYKYQWCLWLHICHLKVDSIKELQW